MPTYEYQCSQCQHRFDLRQGFTDPPQAACLRCGGEAQRRFQTPAILFKGNGWYSTDHRRSGVEPLRNGKDGAESAAEHAPDAAKVEAAADAE
ncbi:MAG: hypothetical protein HY689_06855 [Chloroflexi bacterium]|nr:hypothetical protein [Chloroflexota bacterium]